jgi:hypothetical protein
MKTSSTRSITSELRNCAVVARQFGDGHPGDVRQLHEIA